MSYIEFFVFRLLVATVGYLLFSLFFLISYIKRKKKKPKSNKVVKIKKIKVAKNSFIFCLVMGLISVVMSIYMSLDIIKKDYQETEGTYTYVSTPRLSTHVHFDVNGEDERYSSSRSMCENLEEGKKYRIIYGKRTEIIVECIPIE